MKLLMNNELIAATRNPSTKVESNHMPDVHKKMRCGAKTRKGTPCKRKSLANGRCPNHGGLSTGPKTMEGRTRIAKAQIKRWAIVRKKLN